MRIFSLIVLLALSAPICALEADITNYIVGTASIDSPDYDYIPSNIKLVTTYTKVWDYITFQTIIDTEDNPLEYVSLEASLPSVLDTSTFITVGTNDVIDGFYNSGRQTLTAGSGLLPQGVYSYDFVNGGFSRIFGLGVALEYNDTKRGIFYTLKHAHGAAQTDSKELLEKSVLNGNTSELVDIDNDMGTITSIHINYLDRIEVFALHSEHKFSISKQTNWSTAVDIPTYLALKPNYKLLINRVGLRFLIKNIEITAERYHLSVNSGYTIPGSEGGYVTAQYYNNRYVYAIGRSAAKGDDKQSYARDKFVGVSYWGNGFSMGIEYHTGTGDSWLINKADYEVTNWDSLVVTFAKEI